MGAMIGRRGRQRGAGDRPNPSRQPDLPAHELSSLSGDPREGLSALWLSPKGGASTPGRTVDPLARQPLASRWRGMKETLYRNLR